MLRRGSVLPCGGLPISLAAWNLRPEIALRVNRQKIVNTCWANTTYSQSPLYPPSA